jgi:hypothetical protein
MLNISFGSYTVCLWTMLPTFRRYMLTPSSESKFENLWVIVYIYVYHPVLKGNAIFICICIFPSQMQLTALPTSVTTCFGSTLPSSSARLVKTVPLYVKITCRVWIRCRLLIKIYLELRLYLKLIRCFPSLQSSAIRGNICPREYLLMLDPVALHSFVTVWVFRVICAACTDVDVVLLLACCICCSDL